MMPLIAHLNNVPQFVGHSNPIAIVSVGTCRHRLATGIIVAEHGHPLVGDLLSLSNDLVLEWLLGIPSQVDFGTHGGELRFVTLLRLGTGCSDLTADRRELCDAQAEGASRELPNGRSSIDSQVDLH